MTPVPSRKIISTLVTLTILGTIAWFIIKYVKPHSVKSSVTENRNSTIKKQNGIVESLSDKDVLRQMSKELTEKCPAMLDNETQIDSATFDRNGVFGYYYTLKNRSLAEININQLENYLRPQLISNLRSQPDLKIFKQTGTTMHYIYYDRSGKFITQLIITPQDYQ